MSEKEFMEHLISVGWSESDAKKETYEQYNTSKGDCDGDL